jgi:Fe-S cluster assembly protein SufD
LHLASKKRVTTGFENQRRRKGEYVIRTAVEKNRTTKNNYNELFNHVAKRRKGEPEWLYLLRQSAMSFFNETGFPTVKDEAWKYTNVSELENGKFQVSVNGEVIQVKQEELDQIVPLEKAAARLVFVNGQFASPLSHVGCFENACQMMSLSEAISSFPDELEGELGHHVAFDQNGFTALNTAFVQDGAFLRVSENTKLSQPIHLIFVSKAKGRNTVQQPRNLLILGAGSQADFVEHDVSLSDQSVFTNIVTEVVVHKDASLNYLKIQRENKQSFHIASTKVVVNAKSKFRSTVVDLGSKLARNDLSVSLVGTGAQCHLDGLYLPHKQQHMDHCTTINHPKPKCESHQLYKGVVGGAAKAVFSGRIFVYEDAQKTDAHQTNKNLLLSQNAMVDTKPQLEIFADDVKCTHGAAVGQLDTDSIFYLRSRGLSEQSARKILSCAFVNEIVDRIQISGVQDELSCLVQERLEASCEI